MKHPRVKIIISIVVLCALITGLTFGYAVFNAVASIVDSDEVTSMKLEGIKMTLVKQPEIYKEAAIAFGMQLSARICLYALPLRQIVREEGEGVLRQYENGLVLRRDDDGFVLPENAGAVPSLEPVDYPDAPAALTPCNPFVDNIGNYWSSIGEGEDLEYVLCSYCRISGRYYFLNYIPSSEVETFFKTRMDFFDTIADSASRVYGGYLLSFIVDGDTMPAYYLPPIFEDYEDVTELGISPDTGKEFTEITVDGEKYMYAVTDAIPMDGFYSELYGALIIPYEEYYGKTLQRSAILLIVAAAFMLVLAVWVLAVIKLIRREVITASQRRRYAAGRMRLVALSVGVIGLVTIMLFSMFSDALSALYYDTQTCDAALETLQSIEAENRAYDASLASEQETLYLDYAHRIAEILTEYPDIRDAETLWELNDIIGSDYLMLFDYTGRETVSSTQYLTLSYGDTPESSTYDFRRLITGVAGIVHEPCVDEVTGLNRQLIGVPIGDGNGGKGYDSLIVALNPGTASGQLPMEEVMRTITPSGNLLLAIEKETGDILHASDDAFSGKNAFELGMAEDSLRDDFMDFFSFNGERWYGCINEYDGVIYLCAEKTDHMFGGIVRNGLGRGALFFLAYLILAAVLLWGVTERSIDEYGGRVVEDHESLPHRADDSDRLIDRIRRWWHHKTPEKKAWFTLKLLLGISLAMLVVRIRRSDDSVGEFAIIAYVLNGRWARGVNLFALTQIAIILVTVLLVLLGIDLIVGVISGMVDNKGETVCRLVGSLVKYAAVLLGLFGAFEALGFDTRTLLASVGVFSLAISLGAKDLVADVLSGITIVFSGEYQIDDIVEIGGFRGQVWEIGVRSTTLVNEEGNIKNISNRNVSNVMNLSRMNSVYTMNITVGNDQPLDEVESLLKSALPDIGRRVGNIVGEPEYRGVVSVGAGGLTLAIAVKCAEQDLAVVRARLNAEIKRLFELREIPLR